jgi:hypothetical protein
MVLAVCLFLIVFVAPIQFTLFGEPYDRLIISIMQAFMAVMVVIAFVIALSKLKKLYVQRGLRPGTDDVPRYSV